MIKKVILWTLLVGFSGILIFGAYNRTIARADTGNGNPIRRSDLQSTGDYEAQSEKLEEDCDGIGTGKSSNSQANVPAGNNGNSGRNGNAESQNTNSDNLSNQIQSRGGESQGGNSNTNLNSPVENKDGADAHEWMTLAGSITSIETNSLTIKSTNEQELHLSGRSFRYALESGYTPQINNELNLNGFFENGEYKISEILDLNNGQIISLRDGEGHPLWAGGK
jgi:hypothetical protein